MNTRKPLIARPCQPRTAGFRPLQQVVYATFSYLWKCPSNASKPSSYAASGSGGCNLSGAPAGVLMALSGLVTVGMDRPSERLPVSRRQAASSTSAP